MVRVRIYVLPDTPIEKVHHIRHMMINLESMSLKALEPLLIPSL